VIRPGRAGRIVAHERSFAAVQSRPFGVTILAALCALGGLIALYHTLQYLHILPFSLGPMSFYGFDFWGALLWGLSTLAYVWAMVMLWTMNPQGWFFATFLSGLNLVLAFISLLGASSLQALLPAIIINAAVLIYCLVPSTKEAFVGQA
jgi:hypothetical protein